MAKKRKIIKRVYEKGRETTLAPVKKKPPPPKTPKKTSLKTKEISLGRDVKQIQRTKTAQAYSPREKSFNENIIIPRHDYHETYELPHSYNSTHLVLLVKDPFWIYAYWELTPESLNSLRSDIGQEDSSRASLVLRIYDVNLVEFNGHNANSYFDIDIGYNSNNWYINLWKDGVSYVAEIGMRTPEGRFFPLVRSNCVYTPRMRYSPRSEQIWMKVPQAINGQSEIVARSRAYLQSKVNGKTKKTDKPSRKEWKYFFLTEEDIRNYYNQLSPTLRDIISARITKQYGKKAGSFDFIFEGETEAEKQRILSLLPDNFFLKEIVVGASEKLVLVGQNPKHFGASQGASEQLAERPAFRKFFFELNTELIVYGRTEPDAKVYLGDREVKLRHDGTFSMRFALPDGKIPLEFKAVSADKKETRKIYTYVERNTKYNP
ncbi:MAG: DUF4912 domain-containing protein [Candidatus Omnitrophica bacterium]|nr:DUF4912 domain-containing protein [Candidatus Omnitrophota bacterium]